MGIRVRRRIMVIASVLLVACASGSPAGSPTATRSIIATEQSPAPSSDASASVSPSAGRCVRGPDQQLEPPFCLAGTDELVSNVTEAESTTVTRQTHEQLYAKYDLWAVAPGKLEGKAALSYAFKGTITDTEATGCKVQTAIVDNFSWNVQLVGQYVDQPDGSVLVSFQATPAQGPSYREHFEDCPIPKRTLPGVTWSGVTVTIVGDVYDVDRNLPLPANSTGSIVDSIYIQRGSE